MIFKITQEQINEIFNLINSRRIIEAKLKLKDLEEIKNEDSNIS